jgi:hypothetical protein
VVLIVHLGGGGARGWCWQLVLMVLVAQALMVC